MNASGHRWQQRRLGDVLTVKHGFAFKGEYFADDGRYVVVTPGNFAEGGGFKAKESKEKYYSADPPDEFVLDEGDLILALTDLKQDAPILGCPAWVPVSGVYLHNQRIGRVIEVDEQRLDRGFAYYLFCSDGIRARIRATATGATVRHTAPKRIYELEVPLPPRDIQRRISSILGAYDELIENNTRRIQILEEMAHAIYREWFVDFRYPGHEDVPLVDSALGPIPQGWTTKSFAELGDYLNGFAFKPSHWGDSGLPIVKIKELKAGVTRDTPRCTGADVPPKYLIHDGDLLFSWSADLDAYIWSGGDAWLNQHLFVVTPGEDVPKLFLFHALRDRMGEFRARSQGTTMKHIKRGALAEVRVAVPSGGLTEAFEVLVAPLDSLRLNLVAANRILRATRDLLMPRLISGEIDVSDFDIDVEDASA